MPTSIVSLDNTQYVRINTGYNPLILQAHRDSVRVAISELQPTRANTAFHKLKDGDAPLQLMSIDTNVWVLGVTDTSSLIVTETDPIHVAVHDGYNNPVGSLNEALNFHDADVHNVPVNELFHRHTGVSTTLTDVTVAGVSTSISVADATGFSIGDPIQIENGVIETTFPIILNITGLVFDLDRPLDNAFAIGDGVELIETNLAVDGSATPVAFRLLADLDQVWHIQSFLISMIHSTVPDDAKFGGLPALTKGCVLRGYDGETGSYRTFTVWKTNSDISLDMGPVTYNPKAPAGSYGVLGDGGVKDRTGAVPRVNGATGSYLELLVQDNLTQADSRIILKGQGHIEGM